MLLEIIVWITINKLYLIFTVLTVISYIIYNHVTKNNDYFSKRNVPHIQPTFMFGNSGPVFRRKVTLSEHVNNMYKKLNGCRIGGIFQFSQPMYMIRDPELIKYVTVRDFEFFTDLPIEVPEGSEPIRGKNLSALKGHKWREMRSTLSPAFSSSKMKTIFILISEIGQQLTNYMKINIKESSKDCSTNDKAGVILLNVKDIFTRYTNDVIATAAFGVKCDSLQNPENEFYKMGQEFNSFTFSKVFIFIIYTFIPKLMKAFGIKMSTDKTTDFFRSVVKESIDIREKNRIVRPDMINLLMKLQEDNITEENPNEKYGEVKVDVKQSREKDMKHTLSLDDIVAQALVFFTAGFDFVSTLLSFSTLMLAVHQNVQQKVREELDEVLDKHGVKITYEVVQSMKFLDNVISETLRLYPPSPVLSRKCVKKYTVPESDIIIEPGCDIIIPIQGLHYDEKYFPDPEVFNPDRFNNENKHNLNQYTYLPFGSGPRHCIGNQFALMEVKTALTYLLHEFEFYPAEKMVIPVRLSKSFMLSAEGGFWIDFKLRSQS